MDKLLTILLGKPFKECMREALKEVMERFTPGDEDNLFELLVSGLTREIAGCVVPMEEDMDYFLEKIEGVEIHLTPRVEKLLESYPGLREKLDREWTREELEQLDVEALLESLG